MAAFAPNADRGNARPHALVLVPDRPPAAAGIGGSDKTAACAILPNAGIARAAVGLCAAIQRIPRYAKAAIHENGLYVSDVFFPHEDRVTEPLERLHYIRGKRRRLE